IKPHTELKPMRFFYLLFHIFKIKMKKSASIFFLFICLSCGVTVNYDYEKSTDLSKYKSYSYFTNMNTGLSEFDSKRLFKAVDHTMALKGFTLSEDSDFIINIESSTYQENRRDRKSTRLNSSHVKISYAVFCLKKKK